MGQEDETLMGDVNPVLWSKTDEDMLSTKHLFMHFFLFVSFYITV